MEAGEGLPVGVDQAGLQVADPELLAVPPDDDLGPAQVRAGHAREEVVLDLVVETAQHDVRETASAHVAGGQNLAPQEVGPLVTSQNRHALVVRGEDRAEVDAEEALVDEEKHDRFARRQNQEQRAEVGGEVRGEQGPSHTR